MFLVKKAMAAIPGYLSDEESIVAVGFGDCVGSDGTGAGQGVWTLTDQRLLHLDRKAHFPENFPLAEVANLMVAGNQATFQCDAGRYQIQPLSGTNLEGFLQALVEQMRVAQGGASSGPAPVVDKEASSQSPHESHFTSPDTPQAPSNVDGVMKWNYMHLVIDQQGMAGGKTPADLSEQLSRLGSQGWELVSAFPITQGTGVTVKAVYLFKQPYH